MSVHMLWQPVGTVACMEIDRVEMGGGACGHELISYHIIMMDERVKIISSKVVFCGQPQWRIKLDRKYELIGRQPQAMTIFLLQV